MASSDEEGEILPEYVTNYHLVDHNEEPISFFTLPLCWRDDGIPDGLNSQIFLRGSADSDFEQIFKKVVAWKFELSYVQPEIYVLSKDKAWIMLQKPRKSFENTVKTVLITVHCLHFLKRNPDATKNAVWNHLLIVFSSYEVEPSENDLLKHMPLIKEAASRDKEIAKSEYVASLLPGITEKRAGLHEQDNETTKKFKFIVDAAADDDEGDDDNDGDDDEESDGSGLFDTVCTLCDNGGEVLCCEGRCMRSFHATVDAGAECFCESLGYTDAQVEAIKNFLCRNCQHQQHQCFVCGMLGSSNNSSVLEVFPCVSATCGHFYHPKCVAELLYQGDEIHVEEAQKKIAAGESFTCPAHKCFICKQGEDKVVYELQFAMCRRCPKAYHRKCLPRDISFEGNHVLQRAWDGLLPNRILIYCMNHEIIPGLGTPRRNHVVFPGVDGKRKQVRLKLVSLKEKEEEQKRRVKLLAENRSTVFGSVTERTGGNIKKMAGEYPYLTYGDSAQKVDQGFSRQGVGSKGADVSMKSLSANDTSVQKKVCKPFNSEKTHSFLGNNPSRSSIMPYVVKPKKQDFPCGKTKNTIGATPATEKVRNTNTLPSVDIELEKRMLELMNSATASFNSEEFIKEKKRLSRNECSSRYVVDKIITGGSVEGYVKAIRAALKMAEKGCTLEEAKIVCHPEILREIVRWKKKLRVYLAPFLYGMRYTSFGRHFTKVEKLKEIIDRLHWYVQDNDTIVDFCCGSNDFSWLLKDKLEQTGKTCSFKNYDIIQSKNNFSFEKRDWMSVHTDELPEGSQLIMGLNPPFGVQASLANQFIDKAMTFIPKLIILIVPRETKRLDEKYPPYDLIWEDHDMLSGKSFYLPGSVDEHDQQLDQWNNETPPLYMWSRPDWTTQHKAVAQLHGHLPKEEEEEQKEGRAKGEIVETAVLNYQMEQNRVCYNDFSNIMNVHDDISRISNEDGVKNICDDDDMSISSDGLKNKSDDDDVSISSDELERMLDEGILEANQGKGGEENW